MNRVTNVSKTLEMDDVHQIGKRFGKLDLEMPWSIYQAILEPVPHLISWGQFVFCRIDIDGWRHLLDFFSNNTVFYLHKAHIFPFDH